MIFEIEDSNSFEVLENDYSKDKNFVYFKDKKLEHIDSKTFKVFDKWFPFDLYAIDKNNVICKGWKLLPN